MKYDFSKVKYYDITGKEINVSKQASKPYQMLAAGIHAFAYKNLPLTMKAQSIYKEEAVELDDKEIETIKALLTTQGEVIGLAAHAINSIVEYMDKAKEATTPTKESK